MATEHEVELVVQTFLDLEDGHGASSRSRLVDSTLASDYGAHELADANEARSEAIELARSVREARPDLIGKHCSISVTDEAGAGICVVPIDMPELTRRRAH